MTFLFEIMKHKYTVLYLHEECAIRLILEAKENLLDIWMHGQLLIDFVEDFVWKEIEFSLKASGIV